MNITFDNALDTFVAIVRKHGVQLGHRDAVLRDVYGRLTLFQSEPLADAIRTALTAELAGLVPYVRPERSLVVRGEPGADDVLSETCVQWLRVPRESSEPSDFVRVIERRLAGADWIARPQGVLASGAKRFVFASMKGGVGRTTALCVAASELARRGQRVLVVDLDLEAPGAGAMLAESLPKLGIVDVLAADAVGGSAYLELDMNELTTARHFEQGESLHIVPAYGSTSLDRPENYLAKLARAVADVAVSDPRPLHTRVSKLLDQLCSAREYDVVLVDARAGLAEITAGAILALR
jgi:Mrp family chromosome partitioning ATPase